MLVVDLGKWMNKILIDWGIDAKVADRFDETIIAILMIAIAVGVDYLCQAILVGGMRQYTRRKPHLWNTLLMKRKVFHNLIHTIPAILVYALLPMAFMRGKELLVISQKACAIYIIFSLLLAINGILLMIMDIYDGKETMKNRPMKGFIQVLQVLLFFIGGIVIISILVNKSPASLFAGLGASAAILMLVFKDSIWDLWQVFSFLPMIWCVRETGSRFLPVPQMVRCRRLRLTRSRFRTLIIRFLRFRLIRWSAVLFRTGVA